MGARCVVAWACGLLCAAAVAQTAAPGAGATPVSLDVRGSWRIEQARIEPIYDRQLARLEFGADGRLSGHATCNTFNASYTLEGTQLRIGPLASTRMRCGRLQMEQEDRILSALELATSARVRPDGLLELREADGRGVLRATRLDVAAVPEKR